MRPVLLACALVASARAGADETRYLAAGAPGKQSCASAPSGWNQPDFDDRSWGPRPIDVDAGVGCSGSEYVRLRFDVGSEATRLATLTLRIRYSHGYAAYLNGVEIARRRLDPGAAAGVLANDWHGLEWERVFVPLKPGQVRAGANLLAVEVHPRTAGHEPLVDVELSGATGVRIVRGPYLQQLGPREATVLFDTDLPALGEVRFGATDGYASMVAESSPATHHLLKLAGLQPGAQVHYRAVARAPQAVATLDGVPPVERIDAGDVAFHTPAEERERTLRFVVYSDVRSGHDVHALLDRQLQQEDPDFALVNGDVVDRGSDEGDWERFFEIAGSLLRSLSIFVSPGNHEYASSNKGVAAYVRAFPHPGDDSVGWYSFDVAGVHFVALDSNFYRSPRQLAWLASDLQRARNARGIFVWAHEPPFSTGIHGNNAVAIHDYVPLLEKHKVSMFFGGHDHHYERGRQGGFDYVITGGGGAELRPLKCQTPGQKPCPPRVLAIANEHHYVLVEVLPTFFRICPKRVDGSPLEACTELPLRR
jgi:3',5'-cyclic AMP phosphodiesterase CpdA